MSTEIAAVRVFKENINKIVESTKEDLHSLKEGYLVPYEDVIGCIEHIAEKAIEFVEDENYLVLSIVKIE